MTRQWRTGPGCRGAIAPWAPLPSRKGGPLGQQIQFCFLFLFHRRKIGKHVRPPLCGQQKFGPFYEILYTRPCISNSSLGPFPKTSIITEQFTMQPTQLYLRRGRRGEPKNEALCIWWRKRFFSYRVFLYLRRDGRSYRAQDWRSLSGHFGTKHFTLSYVVFEIRTVHPGRQSSL